MTSQKYPLIISGVLVTSGLLVSLNWALASMRDSEEISPQESEISTIVFPETQKEEPMVIETQQTPEPVVVESIPETIIEEPVVIQTPPEEKIEEVIVEESYIEPIPEQVVEAPVVQAETRKSRQSHAS